MLITPDKNKNVAFVARRLHLRCHTIAKPMSLAPLADVIFLLLIFFIISNSMIFWAGNRVETKLEMPRAHSKEMRAADKLVITIPRETELLFFNDKPVKWENLERELRELVYAWNKRVEEQKKALGNKNIDIPTPMVVLRADKSISYEKIVEVMSLARSLNLGVYLVSDNNNATEAANYIPAIEED